MADPTGPETEFALRRLALEERQADDAFRLREKELEIEALKARAAGAGQGDEHRSKLSMAAISVVSALVGAAASLGAAFFSGHFSVQEKTVETTATAELERQKFSYQLITTALAEPNESDRAFRLRFLVDIGLLDDLNSDEIRRYAVDERERIDSGRGGPSLLPEWRSHTSPEVAEIQRLLGLPADGTPGPVTIAVASDSRTEFAGDRQAITSLLWQHPGVLLAWLRANAVPEDWRAQLERLEAERLLPGGAIAPVSAPPPASPSPPALPVPPPASGTASAISEIQRSLGVPADGSAGVRTVSALLARFADFEGDSAAAMTLLTWHPPVLLGWIRAGALPPDWRAQLDGLEAARLGAAAAPAGATAE